MTAEVVASVGVIRQVVKTYRRMVRLKAIVADVIGSVGNTGSVV